MVTKLQFSKYVLAKDVPDLDNGITSVGDPWHFGADLYPNPFFTDFKNAKKYYFLHIFSYNMPTGTSSSLQHLYEKREVSGSGPLTDGSGWPKNIPTPALSNAQ